MARHSANVPHVPRNGEAPTPLTLEQALEILFKVVPQMPLKSQLSFLAMSHSNTLSLPSHESPMVLLKSLRLPLTPDVLRSVVQAKTFQHLSESDSAFEAKQRAAKKISRRLGGSKGINKRYEKRAPRAMAPPLNAHTTPYGVPWSIGGAIVATNLRVFETTASSTTHFYHWGSTDSTTSMHRRSAA